MRLRRRVRAVQKGRRQALTLALVAWEVVRVGLLLQLLQGQGQGQAPE